jgi:lantibiotic biosynthesis protein
LDLDESDHIEQLRKEIRRLKSGMNVVLQEALPGLDDAWLPGPGGHYIVELVVSSALKDKIKKASRRLAAATQTHHELERMVPPGGSWLYIKLYGSPEIEEDLLIGTLAPFLRDASVGGRPRECFFVRYADPDPHLRVRFRTPSLDDAEALLPEVCAMGRWLMDRKLCSHFVVDTYAREPERYGGSAVVSFAEDLFVDDSALVLELLRLVRNADVARKTLAAVTVLDLLDGFGLDDSELRELASQLAAARQESGSTYRKLKDSLWKLAHDQNGLLRELESADLPYLLEQRRVSAGKAGGQLRLLKAQERLTAPLVDICHSILHMHCNRLIGRDRAQEREVLGLMLRVREAGQARNLGRRA